ncbi:uncharacterized protein LOC141631749 [Silene latifolia]|uniref:uncharacterized protein LOC141631749 n=1 Tax=Silene latifolia TaxID=37657 RepID=UPI003D786E6B
METGHKDEKEIGDVDVDDDEEEKEIWFASETAIIALRMLAKVALKHYNKQNPGKRYALVAHGPNVTTGTIDHVNFKAKEEDCLDAPVETFFAQLTIAPFMRVDCCVSLGPSRNLPHRRKGVELGGCRFCRPIIHHPRERVANLILDPCNFRRNF